MKIITKILTKVNVMRRESK